MNEDIYSLFLAWANRMVGAYVRSQRVEYCEMSIDTIDPAKSRVFLIVLFRENPVTNESPEQNMLQRVFSEIPNSAHTAALTAKEATGILRGDREVEAWYLDDELVRMEKA